MGVGPAEGAPPMDYCGTYTHQFTHLRMLAHVYYCPFLVPPSASVPFSPPADPSAQAQRWASEADLGDLALSMQTRKAFRLVQSARRALG
mmetsp:Transcript_26042/g.46983  ORF Transcript_26042/g.46983 Transcript_26042/m.46983 type:complete len:90 (-) Transcript_26042:205-474(-)